jgi:hypothetical protein
MEKAHGFYESDWGGQFLFMKVVTSPSGTTTIRNLRRHTATIQNSKYAGIHFKKKELGN